MKNPTNLQAASTQVRLVQPAKAIARLLAEARGRFGMEIAFVSEFENGCRVFRHVQGSAGPVCLAVGFGDPYDASYCARIVDGRAPNLMRDAQVEPSVADLPVTHQVGIGAHLSVPIVFSSGRVYGTFCCFSRSPNESLTERDVDMLRMMASLIVDQLEAEEMQSAAREGAAASVRALMEDGVLTTVFQPVVRLVDRSVMFVEALSRFQTDPPRPPDEWFAAAWTVGLGPQLELLAVRSALKELDKLPPHVKMSFNLSPETALGPELIPVLSAVDATRLVVEVTEHANIVHYEPLRQALRNVRSLGVSLAIDDVGSGHSGLQRLLELTPDVLKLDVSITRNLHSDPLRRSLATAIASFASAAGLATVAEGVETNEEADALRDLGIGAAQGYLFGRPAPMSLRGGPK